MASINDMKMFHISLGYDIKLDPAVLTLLTLFGGLVEERASGRKKKLVQQT